MTRFQVEVVVRSEHVARHDGREKAAVLFEVGPVVDVDQAFRVAVAKV